MTKCTKHISAFGIVLLFIISIFTGIMAFADDNIVIDTAFTDPVFKDCVKLHYDTNKDGLLSEEERNIDTMIVSGLIDELAESRGVDSDTLKISSLNGIESFSSLTILRCNNIGEFTTLDFSCLPNLEWLDCSDNGLSSINIEQNTKLTRLHCCSNEFTSLDLTSNKNLEWVHCYSNLKLESLNVSSLDKLEELRCHDCALTFLDLSTNTSLSVLNCSYNHLSSLDLSATAVSSLTDYDIGNQTISAVLIYEDGLIKAPVGINESAVFSTSLDTEEKAYKNGTFFTDNYSKIENGFTYEYLTGKSSCAEMEVSVSVSHSESYIVSDADYENKKLTVKCQICGEEHILDATYSSSQTDPDCTNPGEKSETLSAVYEGITYTDTKTETLDALGHIETPIPAVAPTCTEDGLTAGVKCSRCQAILTAQQVDPKLGHVNETIPAVAPTCTEDGLTAGIKCSRCQAILTAQQVDPKLGHAEETIPAVAPTCTEDGLTAGVKCSRCQAILTAQQVDPKLGHAEETIPAVAPTCTEDGLTAGVKCSRCQAILTAQQVDPKLGHIEETIPAVAPTCTEDGLTAGIKCSRCQAILTAQQVDPKLGHAEETIPAVAPTCTEDGLTAGVKCSRCQAILTAQQVDPKLGHAEETIPAVAPTCTEDGLTAGVKCSRCQAILTAQQVDPKLGHAEETIPAVAPTCTEDGLTAGVKCSRCQAVLTAQQVDPKLGHAEETIPAVAPTCTEDGLTAGVKCSRCQAILTAQQVDPKLGHDYNAVVTNPTCTEKGYTTHTCSRCKHSYSDTYTNAKGHKWDDGVITVQPDIGKAGQKTFTCTVCHTKKTEAVPALTPAEVTPSETEANNAKVNKTIKKPAGITTVSNKKRRELHVSFKAVPGAQNYRVMFRKAGAKSWTYSWTKGKTEYVIKNLKNNGLYEFRFAAYKKNSRGKWERGDYSKTSYRYYYKAVLTKVTPAKKAVKLSWKRNKSAAGYQIEYATNYKMKNSKKIKINSNSKTSYTIKGLKKGKKYYFRVHATKKKGGKTYIGEYSKRKGVKVK